MRLADGEAARTACARVLVRGGTVEKTGEYLAPAVLAERVAWCAALVREMAAGLLDRRWNAGDVQALASGRDDCGRPLPAQAWTALRRLGWGAAPPDGTVVNDRVVRMAQEQAGRLLRSAGWRAALTAGILLTWPAEPLKRTAQEWAAVRAAVPGGEHVPSAVVRARTRQVERFLGAEGRLPADVFEMEAPPGASGVLLLPACDRQQAAIERSAAGPGRALLRLQLPVRPDPRGYRDWKWVAVPLALPPTVPAGAVLHLPALRVVNGTLRAEVAFTSAVPRARRDGHVTALGVDWGLNTLLSAGAARLHPDGTITALGAGAQYRAAGVLAKTHRLRRHGERLHAKADQYEKLGAARPGHPLAAKAAVLAEERRRVSERRSHLNGALAWSAARWAVDQAIAAGASVIYLEDLRTLEARGMGRTLNVRLSQTVRGQIADRIRHLASEHGIAVVTVPARGTSKYCPRCLAQLRHHGSDSSIRRSCCPAVTISGVRFRKQVIRLPLALPSPVAVCTFTSAGVLLAWAKPSAIAMTDASCRASTKRKSSGKSLRNVSSVDPGLPNTVVSPRPRSSPNVASRTLSTRSSMSPPGA